MSCSRQDPATLVPNYNFFRSNSNLAACSGHSLEPHGASTCLWPLEAFNHQGTSNMNRSRLDCTACSYRLARLQPVRDGCAALSLWLSKLRRHLQRLHHVSPVVCRATGSTTIAQNGWPMVKVSDRSILSSFKDRS